MKDDSYIAELARLIAADISDLEGITLQTVRPQADEPLRALNELHGLAMSEQLPIAIELRISNGTRLRLTFYDEPDLLAQFENSLGQLQDSIVESMLIPWPPCPLHSHILVPVADEDALYWQCPEAPRVRFELGMLPHQPRQ